MNDDDLTIIGRRFGYGGMLAAAFGIRRADRRGHLYALGKTGTGKSTLLERLIVQDIQRGEGVALLDPHGDQAARHPNGRRRALAHADQLAIAVSLDMTAWWEATGERYLTRVPKGIPPAGTACRRRVAGSTLARWQTEGDRCPPTAKRTPTKRVPSVGAGRML